MLPNELEVSAVFFDLDGTLLDTVPLIVASHQHALTPFYGAPQEEDWLRSTIGLPLEYVYNEEALGQQAETLRQAFIDYNLARTPFEIGIFLGVVPMLEALRAKSIPLGVVTAKRRAHALYTLEQNDLLDYFSVVIGREDSQRHKPYPDPLFEGLRRMGIDDREHLLYVGDSVHDLEAARNAGCYSAAVDWTEMPKEELSARRPTLWLKRARDLPAVVRHRTAL